MASVTRTVSMIIMSIMSSMVIMTMIVAMPTPSYFVKLDTVTRILFFPIKSDICEVVPDREKCRVDEIRKEKFVEHEDNPKRNDHVLVTHDIPIVC